jgi:hypothetical protein
VESGPSLAKLCSDRIDVIKADTTLVQSHQSFGHLRISSIQIIDKFNTNQALATQSRYLCSRMAILEAAKQRKSHPAALWPYCSSDKRLGLAFFYLVSRTRILSVHEPVGELITFALPDIFFNLVRSSIASVSAVSYTPRLAKISHNLTEPCLSQHG